MSQGIASKKLKKVLEAEELAKKLPEANIKTREQQEERDKLEKEYQERLEKAIKIYKDLCLSSTLGPDDKIVVLVSFLKTVPSEGREMLIKWRDTLPFVSGKEMDDLVKLLTLVTQNPGVDSHERSVTAVTLYNRVFFNVCFKCFEFIATDKCVLVDYRIDACRYLFGSELSSHQELSQECLTEILEDYGLPSEYRYKIIAGFISKTGIATYLNKSKIKIPYDEMFVYGLQSTFFYSDKNGIRERILSGQHLLQMECVDPEEKRTIGEMLMATSSNQELDENIRADAADVVLRLGCDDQITRARNLITDLGFSTVGAKNKKVIDKVKTIYNNSQNVHDEKISESVAKYIEKMIRDTTIRVRPYPEIQQEVTDIVRLKISDKSQKFAAYKALNRISVDTATFTIHKVTIAEIFIRVWLRIQKYEGDIRNTLEERLVEELIDMGDTCSSGHSGRFVNVLSAVDNDLKISFEAQVIANVAGRIQAKVRNLPDQDNRASVSMGMMPDAEETDRESYKEFIGPVLEELYEELYKEFVDARYISNVEFEKYYQKAKEQWLALLDSVSKEQ